MSTRTSWMSGLLILLAMLAALCDQGTAASPKPLLQSPAINSRKLLTPLTATTVPKLQILWQQQLTDPNTRRAQWSIPSLDVTPAGTTILVTVNDRDVDYGIGYPRVRAIHALTGALQWEVTETVPAGNPSIMYESPIVGNGQAYYTKNGYELRAVDLADGRQRWAKTLLGTGSLGWVVPTADTLYYYEAPLTLVNVDPATGAQRRTYPVASGMGKPAFSDKSLYYVGKLGLNAIDYTVTPTVSRWTINPSPAFTQTAPVIGPGVVYHTTMTWVYAINDVGGQIKWKTMLPQSTVVAQMVMQNDMLYVLCQNANFGDKLYALRTTDGSIAWSAALNGTSYPTYVVPRVVNDVVFINGWELHAYHAQTGAELWKFKAPASGGFIGLGIANGSVLTGLHISGALYTFTAPQR